MLYSFSEIWDRLKGFKTKVKVATKFTEQVKQVDRILENDKTGYVSTINNFKIHAASVPMKIETENETLNNYLKKWQKEILNKNLAIDIPVGLRDLSTQNYKERWRSSLLALKVRWGIEDFGGTNGKWIVPKQMWFLNGASIEIENEDGAINTRKFYLNNDTGKENRTELTKSLNESIFIRKPFTSLHKNKVVPYYIQTGTVFNALMKEAIIEKQADVIDAIVPYILEASTGSDGLTQRGITPNEPQMKALKKQITDALDNYNETKDPQNLIALFRYDTKLEHIMPDLKKIFDEAIVRSTDKNLLASLGMIELQGFSSTREEAVLNPKVLVEEVYDAVLDWTDLLQNVMLELLERNKAHKSLSNASIRVVPGKIKAFITDDMRAMLRSLYDRGLFSKQSACEDIADVDFETEIERHVKEANRKLQDVMYPPIIQNLERDPDDTSNDDNNLEDQDKKPGSPEADNFNKAVLENYMKYKKQKKEQTASVKPGIINTPDELPDEIKAFDIGKQFCYFMTYNCAIEYDNKTVEEAHTLAKQAINYEEKKTEEIIAEKIIVMAPYNSIDDLPFSIKNSLPVAAQMIWLRVFNSILKETGDEDRARRGAWSQVEKKYKKDGDDKWVKKASLEDYREKMSVATFKLFEDLYSNALEKETSEENALETSLAIIEKISTVNDKGILVKDKTVKKAQLETLNDSEVVDKILGLQLKEKKLELIDRLLKEDK